MEGAVLRYIISLLILFLQIQMVNAQDVTSSEDFYRGDDFVSGAPPAQIQTYEEEPPVKPRPKVEVQPAEPRIPVSGGQGGTFTNTSARDRKAPIFPKFQQVFNQCAEGCNAGRAHCYGQRNNRTCHSTGDAIDVHGLICGGVTYNAYSDRFKKFVSCVKSKSYKGTRWKALYRQTDKRNGCNSSGRNHTTCHWDHAHFSLGCWRNGKITY